MSMHLKSKAAAYNARWHTVGVLLTLASPRSHDVLNEFVVHRARVERRQRHVQCMYTQF